MNICIVGWYGTETLGDRAILLGIAKLVERSYGKSKIYLGSIHPFYSERCLTEDMEFYNRIAPNVSIEVFDVKNINEYKSVLNKSSIVAMGGGPIMDLYELGVIEFGFGYAKKNGIKTAIIGCGVGPLYKQEFRRITSHILELSDLVILRDPLSVAEAKKIMKENNKNASTEIMYMHDPAIIPIGDFIEGQNSCEKKSKKEVVINLRQFPSTSFKDRKIDESVLVELVKKVSQEYESVKFLPMHTFYVGGDDRLYLSKIKQLGDIKNCTVMNKPISVYELFETIYKAEKCIGMRYHSVVFQTLINGSNAIIDYTEPQKGKISGFLNIVGGYTHYKDLYINIQSEGIGVDNYVDKFMSSSSFEINSEIYIETEESYVNKMKELV